MAFPRSLVSVGPLLAATLAIALVATIVEHAAPAGLLLAANRPGGDPGDPTVRLGRAAYPRHATGADGVGVTIARPVRRVVSQDPAIDEYVYAVVPPERVVGVSESASQPAISNVYRFTERFHPIIASDPEAVVRADPDLVLVSSAARSDFSNLLRTSGVPVYRMYTVPTTLAHIESQIRVVGYLTGEDDRAAAELARFREAVRRASASKPAGAPAPRVLGLGGHYSYGSQTLFHDVLRVLGAVNVGAEHGLRGYDALTDERIVRWNPDWIVAGADRGTTSDVLARLLAQPAIAGTTAAARGQIVVLEQHVFLPLSPYTTLLLDALADAFYGVRQ